MDIKETIKKLYTKFEQGIIQQSEIKKLLDSDRLRLKKFGYAIFEKELQKDFKCSKIDLIFDRINDTKCFPEFLRIIALFNKNCKLDEDYIQRIEDEIEKRLQVNINDRSLKFAIISYLDTVEHISSNFVISLMLKDNNEEIRIKMVNILGKLDYIGVLVESLKLDEKVKVASLRHLLKMNNQEKLVNVSNLFTRGSLFVKRELINCLIENPKIEYIPILKEGLATTKLKNLSIVALGKLAPHKVAEEILIQEAEQLVKTEKGKQQYIKSTECIRNLIKALTQYESEEISLVFTKLLSTPYSPIFHYIVQYFNNKKRRINLEAMEVLVSICKRDSSLIQSVFWIIENNQTISINDAIINLLYFYGVDSKNKSNIQVEILDRIYSLSQKNALNILDSIDTEKLLKNAQRKREWYIRKLKQKNIDYVFE